MGGPKRMYLAARHPSLTPEEFKTRWRAHGALAMGFMAQQHWENVACYLQCDAIRLPDISGLATEFDGVAMNYFHSAEARRRHLEFALARKVLEEDEDQVFAARVNTFGWVAEEVVQLDHGDAEIGLIRVIHKTPLEDVDVFESAWRHQKAADMRLRLKGHIRKYVQNWPLQPENGRAWGLDCSLIDEIWFAGVDQLREAWNDAGTELKKEVETHRASMRVFAVRKNTLYPAT